MIIIVFVLSVHKSSSCDRNLVSKIGNFMRSMSCSKYQKNFDEGWMYD